MGQQPAKATVPAIYHSSLVARGVWPCGVFPSRSDPEIYELSSAPKPLLRTASAASPFSPDFSHPGGVPVKWRPIIGLALSMLSLWDTLCPNRPQGISVGEVLATPLVGQSVPCGLHAGLSTIGTTICRYGGGNVSTKPSPREQKHIRILVRVIITLVSSLRFLRREYTNGYRQPYLAAGLSSLWDPGLSRPAPARPPSLAGHLAFISCRGNFPPSVAGPLAWVSFPTMSDVGCQSQALAYARRASQTKPGRERLLLAGKDSPESFLLT